MDSGYEDSDFIVSSPECEKVYSYALTRDQVKFALKALITTNSVTNSKENYESKNSIENLVRSKRPKRSFTSFKASSTERQKAIRKKRRIDSFTIEFNHKGTLKKQNVLCKVIDKQTAQIYLGKYKFSFTSDIPLDQEENDTFVTHDSGGCIFKSDTSFVQEFPSEDETELPILVRIGDDLRKLSNWMKSRNKATKKHYKCPLCSSRLFHNPKKLDLVLHYLQSHPNPHTTFDDVMKVFKLSNSAKLRKAFEAGQIILTSLVSTNVDDQLKNDMFESGNINPVLLNLIKLFHIVQEDWHVCPVCPYSCDFMSKKENIQHILTNHITPSDEMDEVFIAMHIDNSEENKNFWYEGQKQAIISGREKFSSLYDLDNTINRIKMWISCWIKDQHICHHCEKFNR